MPTYGSCEIMEHFDKTTAISELSIYNAPKLRCNEGKFTTCGQCESCELGSKLLRTKEWFLRCSEQAQRQFVLGLVHRFHSIDLHEYTNSLLTTLEGKDFTYARSRNRPSLIADMSGSVSNHALDTSKLRKDILDCLNWFEFSPYWTKCNFMLGLMQSCNAQLLHTIGNESRSYCLVHEEQSVSEIDGKPNKSVEDLDTDELGLQNEEVSLRVTFSSIYQISSGSAATIDVNERQQSDTGDHSKSLLDSGESKDLNTPSVRHPRVSSAKQTISQNWKCEDVNELYEDDYVSVEPSSVTDLQLSSSCLLLQHHKDFIRCLPVHLSKLILSYLDKASLVNCLCISRHWRILCEEVQQDVFVHQIMMEEVMMMQGATAKGLSASYAKRLKICIPKHENETHNEVGNQQTTLPVALLRPRGDELKFRSMAYCYEGIETVEVDVEERNLFCGPYNVFVLQDSEDPNRCTTYNGGSYVAVGSSDRRVRLVNVGTGRCEKIIKGHSGSIRSLLVNEKRGFVLSGSYDTSIRHWDIRNGKCHCIFRGHRGTVLCMAVAGNILASGSRDKSVKVWNFDTGKCRRTFRHRHVVHCVEVSETLVVSGCEGCKVKVWDIHSATLIKSLEGHQCPITGVTFNKYHIVSTSTDRYALAWSAIGGHTKCLQAFRHPKAVHCVKLSYCRVITGAADGKLRIWSLLTGDCLRIIRGNSKNDVISSLFIVDDRIVINTLSNLLVLNFEAIIWNYNLPPDRPESLGTLHNFSTAPLRPRPRSYIRAQKLVRGAHVDRLIDPVIAANSLKSLLERSVSSTPCNSRRLTRVSSAPAHVSQQVNHSIDQHVQRLHRARKPQAPMEVGNVRKPRPQSSPAHMRSRRVERDVSYEIKENNQAITEYLERPVTIKQGRYSLVKGRSAPALNTAGSSGRHRGWTTSAEDFVLPHNKLMPTAAQAREHVRRRPQSAESAKTVNLHSIPKHEKNLAISKNLQSVVPDKLMTTSCLNLRTFSEEVANEKSHHPQSQQPRKMSFIKKTTRPQTCLT